MNEMTQKTKHVTILLPGGLVASEKMEAINRVAAKFNLTHYVTTSQNLRLLGADEDNLDEIKNELISLGFQLKTPGKFPLPKVCVGMPYCNLGLADTFELSERIVKRYGNRSAVKPKYKISISGCPANCGGALQADIGIVATRKGLDLFAGGKGGPLPRVGKKIAKGLTEDEILEAVGRLVDFHAEKTTKKQRMFKLLDDPDFPFSL